MSDLIRDLTDEQARAALVCKWGAVPEGTVPAWVAEMDYAQPEAVTEAVAEAVRAGTLGYPPFGDGGLGAAYDGFATRHWGWSPGAETSVPTGGAIAGLLLAVETLAPPGPVVVPLPCYPPFRDVVEMAGRELVGVPLDPDDPEAALDLAAVERAFAAGARSLLLCNPHNPLGRVPRRAELEALRDLARAHGALVISDEVHGPLVLPGGPAFTPYLAVDPGGVVVTSHSKTFGTPGLNAAQIVALDPDHLARLRGVPIARNHGYSPLGMLAGRIAWRDCDDWLAALLTRLGHQRDLLADLLAAHLPQARSRPLEATYLAWLDLRAYAVDEPAARAQDHGLWVGAGQDYQPGLPGHVRVNLATDQRRLTLIVERLAAAVGA